MTLQAYRHGQLGLPGTAALERDLVEIRYLLKALCSAPAGDVDEREDITWLRDHERSLRSVLAARAVLGQRQIVDLAQWRSGRLICRPLAIERVA